MTDEKRLAEIAKEIVNGIYGGFDSHVTPKGNMLIDAITAALRAAHGAGMQKAAEIADRMAKDQSSDSRAAMAEEIAAAILAQKDQAS